ncbi:MAG TPA: ParB N-terminal domain-containing protein [Gemmataceae bacterium]|nr:ParB N-terminal domain-containing protein [Gemmataceae bacterium]
MKTLVELAWQQLQPDPNQPRKEFGMAELEALEQSLFVRQEIPLIVRPTHKPDLFQIIDGERRWRAVQLKNRIAKLWCVITDEPLMPSELRVFQITSSVHRSALSGYEMWQACVALLELNPTWQQKDLATNFQMEPSCITRYLSPSQCTKAWKDALKDGVVGVTDCYEASKLPDEHAQDALLAMKRAGASRNALAAAGRKIRNGNGESVKVTRIKAPLPSGIEITLGGKEFDFDEVIESLSSLVKEAKKASASGIDLKTFAAVLKDRAKNGAE